MTLLPNIGLAKAKPGLSILDGVADGFAGFALAAASAELAPDGPLLFVARDGQRLPNLRDVLAFAAPDIPVLELPGWDSLPYDRVSPSADAAARRLEALAGLAALRRKPHRAIVLTTANALLQRIPPADLIEAQSFNAKPGNQVEMATLIARLESAAFERVGTVREVGAGCR
jgi:transcription-repair coupling factor (superfamily II helicase)